jgi:hypothetical protein
MLVTAIGTFGQAVTYIRSAVEYQIAKAIFDKNHTAVDPNTGAVISSNTPTLKVRLADLPGGTWAAGDTVVVGGVTYKAVDRQADSEGAAMLVLHKV